MNRIYNAAIALALAALTTASYAGVRGNHTFSGSWTLQKEGRLNSILTAQYQRRHHD
jgi:hypothetical protein